MLKRDIKKEDRFQQLVTAVVKAYYRSPRDFYIGGAVVLAAIIAVAFILSNRPKPNIEAHVMFDEAVLILKDQQRPDTTTAEQILSELVRRHPGHPLGKRANYYLASIAYGRKQYDEARRYFQRFIAAERRDPYFSPAALMGIGNCYEEQGEIAKAAGAYTAALRRYPKWLLADRSALAAGRCWRALNKYRQAEAVYNTYLKANPQASKELIDEVKVQLVYVRSLAARK